MDGHALYMESNPQCKELGSIFAFSNNIYRTSQKPHVGETRCPCAPTTIKKHMKSADQTALGVLRMYE